MPYKAMIKNRKSRIDAAVDSAHTGRAPKPKTPGKASVTKIPLNPKKKPKKVF